ncbi:hypothetical protein EVAR_61352_1 [Eumeta japonica]|uniref:Uncharacterized protein n=1 Tax=Eumeta variegata TaxID=151549 RepID=A0A4C1ZSX3_EUMVA|nr:hypothetical protein EVAR_61352_1 [Eumeta japonica]
MPRCRTCENIKAERLNRATSIKRFSVVHAIGGCVILGRLHLPPPATSTRGLHLPSAGCVDSPKDVIASNDGN